MSTNNARNPFSIYLLRLLIEWESSKIFNDDSRNCLINYIATPKRSDQKSISDIRLAAQDVTELQIDSARSVVGWVIQRKNRFDHSDDMLNRVVQRITFFGNFLSWEEFESHYARWTDRYSAYINKNPKKIIAKLVDMLDDAERLLRAETIFVRQSGRLEGKEFPGIIRLTEGHIIRQVSGEGNANINDEYFEPPKYKFDLGVDSIISSYNQDLPTEIEYGLIDGHIRTVGKLKFMPIDIVRLERKGDKVILDCNYKSFEEAASIFVYVLSSTTRQGFRTIVFRLADVFYSIFSNLGYLNRNGLDQVEVTLSADAMLFDPVSKMLNFSKTKPIIPPFSPKKIEKRDKHFYKFHDGLKIFLNPKAHFYRVEFIELYKWSDEEVFGFGLY